MLAKSLLQHNSSIKAVRGVENFTTLYSKIFFFLDTTG